ncbi:MAG: addiction module antidote protein, HigA family [Lautropia sp.]|nr:addiction module antidote protein, HigA family [Lautropia sp.]MBW7925702.1 HigA family addiction module antidote protein [Burkholderiaceae bacterium]MCZ2414874.1 HigA family addiction module antidote protein [Burkholderiales bacterium]MDL1905944.1 HigA family addiction module antidote protein [Betaproteobacteria bacterium PRO1]MCL4700522.1 HigA family addiction module antidote protein [Burkholderiaceae bacterium]
MTKMFNPPHPGLTLRDEVLPELGLSVTEAAEQLGVARVTLSRVLNGRAAISPEMALRLQAWLGRERGGDARVWLAQQTAHDLWQAEQQLKRARLRVRPVPVAA